MKRILVLTAIISFFILNAYAENNISHKITEKKPIILTQEGDDGTGGNPEVYIAHQCLINKSIQSCFDKLFLDERKVYIQSYKIIKLAGRGTSVEKATIEFEGDDVFLLYLDTSKVKVPLSTNIESTKMSSDENSVLFMFPVQKIGETIIVKDKQGNVVLQYKVLRKQ